MTRSAGLAVLGAVVVMAAGYLLQFGLGRSVLPADFAFLQETLAFYMMAMLPLQPIGAVVTKQAAVHDDRLWESATRPALVAGPLLACIALFLWAGRAAAFEWNASTLLVFLLSIATGLAFLISNSIAIGRLDFAGSTLIQTIQASLRVGFGLPLVLWGTGARGLWCATAIANGSAALWAKWRLSRAAPQRQVHVPMPSPMKRDFAIAVCCYAGIAVLTQIDLVYARRSFPRIAIYGGAALLGKLVFYLPAAASSVALPLLARARAGADSARVMKRAIVLVAGFSALCFAGAVTFGQPVAARLLGDAYARSGPYVAMSAAAMLPYSLVNLFAQASLSAGRAGLAIASVASAVAVIAAASLAGLSLAGLAALLAVLGLALAIVGWLDTRRHAHPAALPAGTGVSP